MIDVKNSAKSSVGALFSPSVYSLRLRLSSSLLLVGTIVPIRFREFPFVSSKFAL
jgi:hypothetical protein